MKNISFIGLGAMGVPMALNLINKKYNLYLYDINKKKYKFFTKYKTKIAHNYKDLTENTNIFISMLHNLILKFNYVFLKNWF